MAVAANAQLAFEEIVARFTEQTGVTITLVTGSTGTLSQQIENGAPIDVFAAADTAHLARLADRALVQPESQAVYARGRLALVVNKESGLAIEELSDLSGPGVRYIAIANPAHAPYGKAAQEALMATGIWEEVSDKLVWAENVRQALQFVQTGDAPAGIVALANLQGQSGPDAIDRVWFTEVPANLHAPIDQGIAVTARGAHAEAAQQFVQFVTGPAAREIFTRYGYQTPDAFE